jgi:hypothetical protein
MSMGVGGEGFLVRGLAIGGELGYVFRREFSRGIGRLSANPAFLAARERKLVPFVTAGYSLAFRQDAFNPVNYAGRAAYWFRNNLGLRLEARDHRAIREVRDHFPGFRVAFLCADRESDVLLGSRQNVLR